MTYTTLISTEDLHKNFRDHNWVVVDCHYLLDDPEAGRRAYLEGHIPGARYAHLDQDLSGPIIPRRSGRHPLPSVDKATETFSRWGISGDVQVVAYDARGGAIAARLWWMLRWLGHDAVAVLDGGFHKWEREGLPVSGEIETQLRRSFTPNAQPEMMVSARDVLGMMDDPKNLLFDSRAPERYRGEAEPLDAKAGHIPGAISLPFADNLTEEGQFLPVDELKARFESALADQPAENSVFYCGSGVTAAHNILAMEHAGLGEARLYAGSWSEWIMEARRPVEVES